MTTSGLIMMLTWCGIVTIVTGYFFYKVLTAKKKKNLTRIRTMTNGKDCPAANRRS